MTRLATHERKMNPVSREAWKVVTGETPINTNKGPQQATGLIYHWFKMWMRSTLKRSIDYDGQPLTPGFRWRSSGYFNGRTMVDVAQELEGEALEGAGRGVETHDATKGPLIAWMRYKVLQHLNGELERWIDTSSSVGEVREPHESLDKLLGLNEEEEDEEEGLERISRRQRRERKRLVDAAALAADPAETIDADPVDREMCDIALTALSAMEREVLLRFSEGESYESIARNVGLSKGTNAQRIVARARRKAQEALA